MISVSAECEPFSAFLLIYGSDRDTVTPVSCHWVSVLIKVNRKLSHSYARAVCSAEVDNLKICMRVP